MHQKVMPEKRIEANCCGLRMLLKLLNSSKANSAHYGGERYKIILYGNNYFIKDFFVVMQIVHPRSKW